MIRKKAAGWAGRYGRPLVSSMAATLISANIAFSLTGSAIISAFIATWVDNTIFYGMIAYKDLASRKKQDGGLGRLGVLKVLRNMLLEFGPAEWLDSLIVRPLFLSTLPYLISNYSLAIIVGAVAADATYFIPTIIAYETRIKVLGE